MAILQDNQTIGKYVVKRPIKENQYCETYRVEDEKDEPFFLKLFILKNTPENLLNEDHQVNSIALISKLQHKNIISFVESGELDNEQVGKCQYVITNYFSGELLADKIQREGKLPLEQALQILQEIVEGLNYLHEQGYYHNDITPRNIMLSERTDGTAEIIDMTHLSKFVCGAPSFDTSDLDERYQSNPAFNGIYDEPTDLFSALAVFYTMVTGRIPWDIVIPEGSSRKERIKIAKAARKQPLELDDIEVPEGIRRIFAKGLGNGTCSYNDADTLLKDLNNPDDVEEPKQNEAPRQQTKKTQQSEAESDTAADVQIQKGKGHGFEDIAGMNDLKTMLRQKVIFILTDKERAEKYRLTPPNGMLLYGPPGCGKSFFAEKFAEEAGFNFILVKASDLGSIYIHGTQGKIADLFKKAEANAPTILCFDEFDAFVPDRSGGANGDHQAGEVNEFLSQLNNCAQRGIFVIATSNRPDKIDPAVLRTGRIDRQIYVPLPEQEARREMFKLHLKGRPCDDIDAEKLATMTEGYIASDIAYIVNDAAMGAAFSDQPISQKILEDTINCIRPSISKTTLNFYDSLRDRMEDTNRRNVLPKIGFV